MARSGNNGIGGSGKGIGNRKHEGGKHGLRKEKKRVEAIERLKTSAKKANTGLRSTVRYGFLSVEEALKMPLSENLKSWLKRRN